MKFTNQSRHPKSLQCSANYPFLLCLPVLCLMTFSGCSKGPGETSDADTSKDMPFKADSLAGGPYPTLLISKAQFSYQTNSQGQQKPVPGAAKLVLLRKTKEGWKESCIEDSTGNVFHNAVPFHFGDDDSGILTISGTDAALRLWRWQSDGWTVQTLWQPHFGGRWDRLRDVEFGDVTGDGHVDIVVATHDQGVVGLLQQDADQWLVTEVDREPNTFVHEVEVGDIDGDGNLEFFTTPSKPNSASLASQPGSVIMYRRMGSGFERSTVDSFAETHAKEILAVDLDDAGRSTLLAAVEAQTQRRGASLVTIRPVEIRAYTYAAGKFHSKLIATLDDTQCRFLADGDVDGDGVVDIVASGMRSGVWLLRRDERGRWYKTMVAKDSSSFEHATLICDLDGDGTNDVVVASDVQGELRRYFWNGSGFEKEILAKLPATEITFNLAFGSF